MILGVIDCQILKLNSKLILTVGGIEKIERKKTKMKFGIKDFTDPGLLKILLLSVVAVLPSQVFLLLTRPV